MVGSPAAAPQGRRLGWLLFAVTVGVYLLSGPTNLGYDGSVMYLVSESLVRSHTLQIVDPFRHVNEPYAYFGIGVSLLLTPFVAIGQFLFHDGRALITLFQPGVTGLTVVALFRLLLELGCSCRRSLGVALVLAFATPAWHYAGELFSEPLVAFCLTAGVLALLVFWRTGRRRWLLSAAMLMAIAVLARWDSLLLVALPLLGYALFQVVRLRRTGGLRAGDLAMLAAPLSTAIAVNLAYDYLRFGHPFGALPGLQAGGFAGSVWEGLYGLLLSPGRGLLIFAPVILLALVGVAAFTRTWRAEALLVLAASAVRLLFYGRWWAWYAGVTWGPRYLVPVVPLLLLPLAFIPRRRWLTVMGLVVVAISAGIAALDQLVPYGLYYEPVADQFTLSQPGVDVDRMLALDWRHALVFGQLQLLLQGRAQPAWGAVAFLMPLVAIVFIGTLVYLWRLALKLDAPPRSLDRAA